MYLTPAQYRAMDTGVKGLEELSDAQLSSRLIAASADVDTFCAVPLTPQRHSFAGGSIVGETHTWVIDPYDVRPRRKAYPYHTPLLELTRMDIHVTPNQYVGLDPEHVYYEQSEGWLEPFDAALTSYGLFGAGVLPFMGATNPWVVLDYTYGYRQEMIQRVYYSEGGWYATSHGFWVTAPVVKVNSSVRVSGYDVDAVEGRIKFTADPPVDGDYVDIEVTTSLPYDIAEATAIIATAKLGDRSWASKGFQGLRDVAVAEVRLTRDQARTSGSDLRANIPMEAQDKLSAYVFRTIR